MMMICGVCCDGGGGGVLSEKLKIKYDERSIEEKEVEVKLRLK